MITWWFCFPPWHHYMKHCCMTNKNCATWLVKIKLCRVAEPCTIIHCTSTHADASTLLAECLFTHGPQQFSHWLTLFQQQQTAFKHSFELSNLAWRWHKIIWHWSELSEVGPQQPEQYCLDRLFINKYVNLLIKHLTYLHAQGSRILRCRVLQQPDHIKNIQFACLIFFLQIFIDLWTDLLLNSLSIHFNGHFPGGPGLANTSMSLFWILLELRMTEVVVTTVT